MTKDDDAYIRKEPTPSPWRISGLLTHSNNGYFSRSVWTVVPKTEVGHTDSDVIVLVRYSLTDSGDTTSSSPDIGYRYDTMTEQSPSADTEETFEDQDTTDCTNEESVTETANFDPLQLQMLKATKTGP